MEASDIIGLGQRVFQLEGGCCEWYIDQSGVAMILYGEIHTEQRVMSVGEDIQDFLPSASQDIDLKEFPTSHGGKSFDTQRNEHQLPGRVLSILLTLCVGQKAMIEDGKASSVYVIKLQDIRQFEKVPKEVMTRALAPALSPGPWELVCALTGQDIVREIIRSKTVHAIPDTQEIFGATLIVFDSGIVSFDGLQNEFDLHEVQLIQGHGMIASLKNHAGKERSEAEVIRGILETKERVQKQSWEQAVYGYDTFLARLKLNTAASHIILQDLPVSVAMITLQQGV